jgi:hypothetical protein
MKLNEAFPSKFLKADDLGESDVIVRIHGIRFEKVSPSDPTPKIIAKVTGRIDEETFEKDWIVNKTNANALAKIHGDDTDDWEGKYVTLYSTEVEYAGETMLGIRCRLRAPKVAPKGKPADDQPPGKFAEIDAEATDKIPF